MKQLLFLVVLTLSSGVYGQTNILPTPSYAEETSMYTYFHEGDTITIEKGRLSAAEFTFISKLYKKSGIQLMESLHGPIVWFSQDKKLPKEGYRIKQKRGVKITYGEAPGAFYAMMSLLQMTKKTYLGLGISQATIEDAPAFEWRGLHLDVSRHFFTVEEIKQFLEIMAVYKFNTFHWHLTDDQGWRIEIKQYPALTSVGGFRDSTIIGHYNDSPRQYDGAQYGGFYTQEEIKEVVAYAKVLHINVVPEIEMPGHSRAALAAYPELSCTGEQQGVPGLWGVFEDIYCSKEESIEFLQNVLSEVLALFPSEYIHIGGDEAPKARWNECDDCQKVMEKNDLHDAHELQSYFIKRMDAYLTEQGRKLIGWDEILEGGLSPNAAVMSWRGEEGGIQAAKQGHYVVMSPTSYCYFDYYQSSHESEPLAIGGFLPLEKVYEYNPIPEDLSKEDAKYILGGQANIWTEYIPDFEQVEYMAYPRAIALMQGLWCQSKPSYSEFLGVYLNYHEGFLKRLGVNRAQSIHIPELKIERSENGVAYSWWGLDSTEVYSLFRSTGPVGGLFSLRSGESIEFNSVQATDELTLEFNDNHEINYLVHRSDILGAEIELVTPPHRKYDHNGSLNLVDGIQGTIPWKGDQWIGFNKEKVEIIVELDVIEQLKTVSIGFLNQNGSWIYLPEEVRVSVSADKENWTLINTKEINSEAVILREKIDLNTYGKYVKIEIIPLDAIPEGRGGAGYTPWTFIDEVQIDIE
ncbi:MAG: family 20 glycosylhydrolase [Crocinitomicaceae bacterium]